MLKALGPRLWAVGCGLWDLRLHLGLGIAKKGPRKRPFRKTKLSLLIGHDLGDELG